MTPQPAASRVLIVAHTTTWFTELSLFGELVGTQTDAETVYFCAFSHWTADDFARGCESRGILCLREPLAKAIAELPARFAVAAPAPAKAPSLYDRVKNFAIDRLVERLPVYQPAYKAELAAYATRETEIRTLLAAVAPRLLVLGGDIAGYDTSQFVKLAHEAGIPVMIVPSTMSNGLEQAEVYQHDPAYVVSGRKGELLARLFPKWVKRHNGKRLLRCPPSRLLAMEASGLDVPIPWVFNSGYADVIAMESEAMTDYYNEAGMNLQSMKLVGTLSDDAMAARLADAPSLRRAFCLEHGLDPQRLLVLCALPPDFLYVNGGRPECDFTDYQSLAEFWVDSLAAMEGCSKVVALHPSVDVSTMKWIEERGVTIARRKTADIVPLCDIYVASISSTIRWAIACGKPVVNYDVYRYRYTDFLGVPGVIAMEDKDRFCTVLAQLSQDENYRREVAAMQAREAGKWGMTDGRVGSRMLAEVTRLSGISVHGVTSALVRGRG